MPVIDDVTLDVTEDDPKVLTATITVHVSMSKLEACFARQCLDGLNEEWTVSATIHSIDFGVESFQPIAICGIKNLDWDAGSTARELIFVRRFRAGHELNEDRPGRDEIAPRAEVRTRQAGVFVTSKLGPVKTGNF